MLRLWLTTASRLFPETCPACGGPTEQAFCAGCRAEFERLAQPCRLCGLPEPVQQCPRRLSPWQVDGVLAPYAYAYPLSHYLQALKFGQGRRLGRALGLLLADALPRRPPPAETSGAAVIAVPLHRRRLRERGYNQALEIARAFARRLELEIRGGLLRVAAAAPQSSLGARARRTNVASAFRAAGDFAGRRIVLVDDVITTGATVNAAAVALRAAGAASVHAVAVARTAPPAVAAGRKRQAARNAWSAGFGGGRLSSERERET